MPEAALIALKPLPVQTQDGERLLLAPGDVVPAELRGRWVTNAVEAGKVAEVAILTDAEFADEAKRRGFRLAPLKPSRD